MRFCIGFMVASLIATPQLARAGDSDGSLTVAGQFSVKAPAQGYRWTKARELEQSGVKVAVYTATKAGSTAQVVLTVEYRKADTEGKKVTTLKGHWDGGWDALKKAGYTDLNGKKPSLEPPIPDQVPFVQVGKDPSGKPWVFAVVTAFGKNVYSFQVRAETEEEAQKLIEVAKSLKE